MHTISITYSPTTLEDFLAAIAALPAQSVVKVNPPVEKRGEAVDRYCAAMGLQRYVRTPEGRTKGWSAMEDLQKRAEAGDQKAIDALQIPIDESDFAPVDPEVMAAPENGEVF